MDHQKRNIHLMYAIALLQGMVFYAPIATLYRQYRGVGIFQITLIESISLLVMIVLELPWGYIADKIGYKTTIVICNILYFISKLVFWKAYSFGAFLAERLLLSVLLAGLSGCDSAFLFTCAKGSDTKRIFGRYEAMSMLGLMAASTLFSALIKNNFEMAAYLTVITYAAAMGLSLLLKDVKMLQNQKEILASKESKLIVKDMIKNNTFLLFIFAGALLAQTNQTITVFLSQLQYLSSGIAPSFMGYIHIAVTMAGLLCAYADKIVNIIGENRLLKLLFLLAGIVCLMMAVWANVFISILCMIILRICASVFFPLSNHIQNENIHLSSRATILSFYSVIMNLTAVATNLLFGKASGIGVEYGMMLGAVFCFGGFLLCIIWQRKNSEPKK